MNAGYIPGAPAARQRVSDRRACVRHTMRTRSEGIGRKKTETKTHLSNT